MIVERLRLGELVERFEMLAALLQVLRRLHQQEATIPDVGRIELVVRSRGNLRLRGARLRGARLRGGGRSAFGSRRRGAAAVARFRQDGAGDARGGVVLRHHSLSARQQDGQSEAD